MDQQLSFVSFASCNWLVSAALKAIFIPLHKLLRELLIAVVFHSHHAEHRLESWRPSCCCSDPFIAFNSERSHQEDKSEQQGPEEMVPCSTHSIVQHHISDRLFRNQDTICILRGKTMPLLATHSCNIFVSILSYSRNINHKYHVAAGLVMQCF